MNILALDTAGKTAAVAVLQDGTLRYASFCDTGLTHSETLLPLNDTALHSCGPVSYTHLVVDLHDKLLRSGGLLMLTCPHFRGGVQNRLHRWTDSTNLSYHVVESMDPAKWTNAALDTTTFATSESTGNAITNLFDDADPNKVSYSPVSYTHLDVYKRQGDGGQRPFSGGTPADDFRCSALCGV